MYTAHLLEKALQAWEQFFFLGNLGRQAAADPKYQANLTASGLAYNGYFSNFPPGGPTAHFQELRPHLLRAVDDTFDAERFFGGEEFKKFGSIRYYPFALHSWSKYSRRVFHLTPELQTLLQHTSLEGVLWNEVGFPFESFVVTLSVPIKDRQGRSYGAIVYCPVHGCEGGRQIHVLPSDIESFKPLNPRERAEFRDLLRRGRYETFEKRFMKYGNDAIGSAGGPMIKISGGSDDSPVTQINHFRSQDGDGLGPLSDDECTELLDYARNILVGMCLYFKSLPPKTSPHSDWELPPQREIRADPRAITNLAEICSVSCQFTLGIEEREALGDEEVSATTGRELPWHRRRGTWRRPPGFGHIPGYPRTVWQRPTWVRKDRMPEGALPAGSSTIVK